MQTVLAFVNSTVDTGFIDPFVHNTVDGSNTSNFTFGAPMYQGVTEPVMTGHQIDVILEADRAPVAEIPQRNVPHESPPRP